MTKRLNPKSRTPKAGAVVYLAVYPGRGPGYGGEWETSIRSARATAESWQEDFEEILIVRARVVDVALRIKPVAEVLYPEPKLKKRVAKRGRR